MGEFNSPVKDERFAMRRVFETGGPIADEGAKSLKAGGYSVSLCEKVEVYS